MILYINTASKEHIIEIAIKKDGEVIIEKIFEAKYSQAERLLPEIEKLLKKQGINLLDIKKIEVENKGGAFTSLRIGVMTANALGYALGVPVNNNDKKLNIIEPIYDREPNIT